MGWGCCGSATRVGEGWRGEGVSGVEGGGGGGDEFGAEGGDGEEEVSGLEDQGCERQCADAAGEAG